MFVVRESLLSASAGAEGLGRAGQARGLMGAAVELLNAAQPQGIRTRRGAEQVKEPGGGPTRRGGG